MSIGGWRRTGAAVPLAAVLVGLVLGAGVLAGSTLVLFPGPGVLATAGILMALVLSALAAAFWVRGAEPARGGGAWWVIAVVIYLVAGPFAEAWASLAWIQMSGWGRAVAVLLLIALPAYGVGSLLASLRHHRGVPAGTLAGTALGVLITAVWLIPKIDPGILFAGGAIILIAASWLVPADGSERSGLEMSGRRVLGLDGKIAIVSGVGSAGQVGYAVAESLVREGCRVVVTGHSSGVVDLARGLGGPDLVVGVAADLTVAEEAERVVGAAVEKFGSLDLLVNVAGGLRVMGPLGETTPDEWSGEVDRNAKTAFVLSRAALPSLRERQGSIINFASPAGLRGQPGIGAYSAAKAAVVALTRSLALEERGSGVRVNAIAPGMVDTEQNREEAREPEKVAWVSRQQVVDLVLFLASDLGSGLSGETIEMMGRKGALSVSA